MDRESVDMSPPPSPGPEQPMLPQESFSTVHGPTGSMADPPKSPTDPMHSTPDRRNWKYYKRRWIPKPSNWVPNPSNLVSKSSRWLSKPSVRVFIILFVVTALSFSPAALSRLGDSDAISTTEDSDNQNYVLLWGEISNFNWGDTEKVSVQWSLLALGRYMRNPQAPPDKYDIVDRAVDVYLNNASQPIFSYDPTLLPTSTDSDTGNILPGSLYSFKTEYDTFTCAPRHSVPNDCYSSAFAFIIEKATNESVPTAFGIDNSGSGDFAARSYGQPSRNNFTHNIGGQQTTGEVESVTVAFLITRSKRAKALTYFMFTINWLLTLSSMVTTAFIFSRRGKVKDSIALVPLMLILTIPTIRSFYPGAPPFGIFLDLVGLFPQMLSVAICIIAVLVGIGVKHRQNGSINDKEMMLQ